MFRGALETAASAVVAFGVGYVLYPPGAVYWGPVSDAIGGGLTILLVLGICVAAGFAVRQATPIAPVSFAVGCLLAYLVGMYLIESTMRPGSPVHRYFYGLLVIAMVVGHSPREVATLLGNGFADLLDLSPRR